MRGYKGAGGEGRRGGDVLDVNRDALGKLLDDVERRVGVGGGELVGLYVGKGVDAREQAMVGGVELEGDVGAVSSVGGGRLL